jgi:RNA polymerase sigma-70 factor (ECF subfamily)
VNRIKLDGYEVELLKFAQEIAYYLQKSGASAESAHDITQDVLVKMLENEGMDVPCSG